MADYAQTNIQLFRQLQQAGYSDDEMNHVARGHDVALRLFSARFRGSGRPFIVHLVRTASILHVHGARPPVVLAGLLHSAYTFGDFGSGVVGITEEKRRVLRELLGTEIEQLIHKYETLPWNPDAIRETALQASKIPPLEQDVLFMRLANELEDALDDDALYSGSRKLGEMLSGLPPSIEAARSLELSGLASEMQVRHDILASSDISPFAGRNYAFALTPLSCRRRFLPRATNFATRSRKGLRAPMRIPKLSNLLDRFMIQRNRLCATMKSMKGAQ